MTDPIIAPSRQVGQREVHRYSRAQEPVIQEQHPVLEGGQPSVGMDGSVLDLEDGDDGGQDGLVPGDSGQTVPS